MAYYSKNLKGLDQMVRCSEMLWVFWVFANQLAVHNGGGSMAVAVGVTDSWHA